MGPAIIAVGVVAVLFFVWKLLSPSEEVQKNRREAASQEESQSRQAGRSFRSSAGNNHDHLKHRHSTQEEAEREIRRMRSVGKDGCERLNAYYNNERDGWYVGRGQW